MDSTDKVVEFAKEKAKRIHDIHDKRVDELRAAFAKAFPLPKAKKTKPKKKR